VTAAAAVLDLAVEHFCSTVPPYEQVLAEPTHPVTETTIESVLLDADLFVKYSSPEKAFELLRTSLERSPRSISLREKMRDICVKQKNLNEAARQCLALVSLYINREDFDLAYDRLQEAKLLDPRISVAPGLEANPPRTSPGFCDEPRQGAAESADRSYLCRESRIPSASSTRSR